ncbi:MAG: gluconate 5-dehydrogenase [Erysipelotrichaceae bacterium]|nr:gluconate 5-dehydrogenase [Erysipelotrichaceae bacterium]
MSIIESFSLKGEIALVTGASHGIGYAIAAALADAGARIVFCCSSEGSRQRALDAYHKDGIDAAGYVCDVTDEQSVIRMVKDIEANIGTVDILVNNAACIKRVPMHEMSVEDWRKVIDTDLTGQFICAKAVLPAMMEKRHGKIINICSMMSELGRETVAAYASAKGGLKMLTRNIASEYGEYNIQCNAIGPGYIATEQTKAIRVDADGNPTPFHHFIMSKTPANRWGTIEDLKGPAVFLASHASDFVNGHILYVDGGIIAYLGKQPK